MSNKKTLSFLKKEIQSRYRGRGNTWVKVDFESKAFSLVDKLLKEKPSSEVEIYRSHVAREGFAWIRFIKTEGRSIENVKSIFEVRVRGSKDDHPDYRISFEDDMIKDLPLLGNTPLKLQLESEDKSYKNKVTKKIQTLAKTEKEEIYFWESKLDKVKEISLSEPTKKELKEWTDFLSASGLLKDEY